MTPHGVLNSYEISSSGLLFVDGVFPATLSEAEMEIEEIFSSDMPSTAPLYVEEVEELTESSGYALSAPLLGTSFDASAIVWNGSVTSVKENDGNYYIYTPAELAWIAEQVNKGVSFAGKTICLCADIDLNGLRWTPIGSDESRPFSGRFDGDGHLITGLYTDRTANKNYQGLFGVVSGSDIIITDLSVSSVGLKGDGYWKTCNSGIIVGLAKLQDNGRLLINNCSVTGIIDSEGNPCNSGGLIGKVTFSNNSALVMSNCSSEADIKGYGYYIGVAHTGGLIGSIDDPYKTGQTILDACVVNSSLNSESYPGYSTSYAGGLIGCFTGNRLQIEECAFFGSVDNKAYHVSTGGFIGSVTYKKINIINSMVHADLSSFLNDGIDYTSDAGGFLGRNYCTGDISESEIANCYMTGTIKAKYKAGFISSSVYSYPPIQHCYFNTTTTGITTKVTMEDDSDALSSSLGYTSSQFGNQNNFIGWDFDTVWIMGEAGYPELRCFLENSGGTGGTETEITGDFIFSSDHTGKDHYDGFMTYTFSYNDVWFQKSSYEYQHDLTKMSVRMAVAACGAEGKKYSDLYIRDLFYKIGIDDGNIKTDYDETTIDSIGYAIGSKTIKDWNGDDASLIVVAARGGRYANEWGGNFRIGTEMNHEGFEIASNTILSGLSNYIDEYREELCPTVKIWLSGFSRGAAVINLVAKELDDGFIPEIDKENIFAFCFESPQNTRDNNASNLIYNNIVNIVNPVDFIPKVVMSAWGYTRYGKNYYLPYKEGKSKNYSDDFDNMKKVYRNILEMSGLELSVEDAVPSKSVSAFFSDYAAALLAAGFISPVRYHLMYESTVINLASTFLGDPFKEGSLITDTAWATRLIGPLAILEYFPKHITTIPAIGALTVGYKLNFKNLGLAHFGELCIAWLDSMEGDYSYFPSKYRIVYVNCPVNVSVFDSNEVLVAEIIDKQISEIENGVTAFIDYNDQIVIALPNDEEYRVVMDAYDDGEVTYTAVEYDLNTGKSVKTVSYYDVAVEKGDQLIGTVENLENVSEAYYPLSKDEQLTPDLSEEGDNIERATIEISVSGDGEAYCQHSVIKGEYVKATAVPSENATFDGWYIDNEKISGEEEYRFCVKNDVALTAVFGSVLNSIELDKTSIELGPDHLTETLSIISYPSDAVAENVEWGSDNPGVAVVNENGEITAVAEGTAVISVTVKDTNLSADCIVTVLPGTNHVHSFTRNVQEKYLKSAATKDSPAVYYYSCACGEKGTETFEYGSALSSDMFIITWKNYDGTILETNQAAERGTLPEYHGKTPEKPETALFSYSFNGWTPAVSKAEANADYTAQFIEVRKNYAVTFNANGHGTAPASQTVAAGAKAAKPQDPSDSVCTFGGWFKEAACTNEFDFTAVITKDTVLYAKWTKKNSSNSEIISGVTPSGGTVSSYGGGVIASYGRDIIAGLRTPVTSGLPSWVEKDGEWSKDSADVWHYTNNGLLYRNRWGCIYNPFAPKGRRNYDWFFFDENGSLVSGWLTEKDGNVYYLNPAHDGTFGAMITGWYQIDGKWYFFSDAEGSGTMGAMLRNTATPDGYKVGEDGSWIK